MRKALRTTGIVLWSLFSIEVAIGILDWAGRWDYLVAFLKDHPRTAAFVHTPFAYLVLFVLGLLFLKSDRILRQPSLLVRLLNNRNMPDESTTPVAAIFNSAAKTPGWDETKLDWHTFLEIQVTNDSDIATTIAGAEARARIKRGWGSSEKIAIQHIDNFETFVMDVGLNPKLISIPHSGERYRKIPNLLEDLKKVPLERGIGHRGWLRFRLPQVSQKDINGGQISIDVWLVDALGGKHEMVHRKGNEKNFDQNFFIFDDKDGLAS